MNSLVCVLVLAAAAPAPKDEKGDREFREKVDAAREKGVKFLKEKQGKDGSWESEVLGPITGMTGGVTALTALGLLEAGVPANDPAITKAVEYLVAVKPEKTYVVALQTQVLARVDAKKHAKQIQTNADWLMEKAIMKNGKLEGWSYPANAIADNSNTHFAIVGLHAAAGAGAKVDPVIWKLIRDYYAATQRGEGGWAYHNVGDAAPVSQSMTVAGLLALTVAVKYDKQAKGPDPAFEKGMKYLLSRGGELGEAKSTFVGWMTVAELGRALETTEFKSGERAKSWYREGAEKLVKAQQEDGSFKGGTGLDTSQPVISTACALYFLGTPAKK
jgi:hypothetical protein